MTNGISFAIQAVLLLFIGAWADYGTWRFVFRSATQARLYYCRPNINIFFTLLAIAVSFAWLGVEDPAQWRAGIVLYILGCKLYL